MRIQSIISGEEIGAEIRRILSNFHSNGPVDAASFESLAYCSRYHPEIVEEYINKINFLTGLFYKTRAPDSLLEQVYSIFSQAIQEDYGKTFTPVQADIISHIRRTRYFSFSAPTSAGKSFLLRSLVEVYNRDIVIIVPSRALIAEYYYEVIDVVGNEVLVLQFVEDIFKSVAKRRIYIVTPERAVELFKHDQALNVGLIIMDEAQVSEDPTRGLKFDAFFRRSMLKYPKSKKVFSHPFIANPEAQLNKHNINSRCASMSYEQHVVGKIFASFNQGKFTFFSPYNQGDTAPCENDIASEIIQSGGTLLIYTSKKSLYEGTYLTAFSKYIEQAERIVDVDAIALIEELRGYIGASSEGGERVSTFIEMMRHGIVIHHGSMPLKARLLIEKFVRSKNARICFATSTLNQGINMPFDLVWIDNFHSIDELALKNLIGRAGRTRIDSDTFDFGYTIVKASNRARFIGLMNKSATIDEESLLDKDLRNLDDDLHDLVESIKENSFNDILHLPEIQVSRIREGDRDSDIALILDRLIIDGNIITAEMYYLIENADRKLIKSAFGNIYIEHLRRKVLTSAENSVLSAAIPMLLWRIQGKSFSEIVSLRYSYISNRDERAKITRKVRSGELSAAAGTELMAKVPAKYSPQAFSLPNREHWQAPLFARDTKAIDVDYDTIVYDTYDFLDKVVSISLADPLCASFSLYYEKSQDVRALAMVNYIKYGTNDDKEIWMMRYGIDPEDIEWLKKYVNRIDEFVIEFNQDILSLPREKLAVISRYI